VTVLDVIQKSAEFLGKKGVDAPRLQTELLLAHALKLPRMKLYLNFERQLTSMELDAFRELVKRRARREPLQHIVGSTSFCGLEISVNHHVMVPRPETEILAELGWQFLNREGRHAADPNLGTATRHPSQTALDFGTGSGCLSIAIAVKCPSAQICAVDVSSEALAVARENAARHNVADRIQFLQGDGFAALTEAAGRGALLGIQGDAANTFDLIISNPPYIPTAEIATLQPEVRDYDPHVALDGGPDGLNYFLRLAAEGVGWLKPDGKLMLEFGDGQAESVRQIFEAQKWIVEAVKGDYSQHPRCLIASVKR
jgi:release factor glutamine methyltransferase